MSGYFYRIILSSQDNVRIEKTGPGNIELGRPTGRFDYAAINKIFDDLPIILQRNNNQEDGEIKRIGECLFSALFDKGLQTDFISFYEEARNNGEILNLQLDIDENRVPKLTALPWEVMRVPGNSGFSSTWLASNPNMVFSRTRSQWIPAKSIALAESERLRIALVVAKPEGFGPVKYEMIWEELQTISRKLPDYIELCPLVLDASRKKIDEMLIAKPHIVHFIGHGRLRNDEGGDIGEIALLEGEGFSPWVDAERFAGCFDRHRPGILLLQTCEGGAFSPSQAFAGVASRLVEQNISIVIAMQFPISNSAAKRFVLAFYDCLSRGMKVDQAVQEGRREIANGPKSYSSLDFASPIIISRVPDGQLFLRDQKRKTPKEWTPDEIFKIVNILLESPIMSNRNHRDAAIDLLPKKIRGNISRSSADRVDMINIVRTCLYYEDGIRSLVEILRGFEDNSKIVQSVTEYLSLKIDDPEQTYQSLLGQMYQLQKSTPKNPDKINELSWELLIFTKEQKNNSWGFRAFCSAEQAGASEQILRYFIEFAPSGWKGKEEVPQPKQEPSPNRENQSPIDQIPLVATVLGNEQIESGTGLLGATKECTIHPIMIDLNRQGSIRSFISAEVENSFICLEAPHSTLVLLVKNLSTKPITSVVIQLITEGNLIWFEGRGERLIDLIEPASIRLVTFPYELKQTAQKCKEAGELVIRLSIRASFEEGLNQAQADVRIAIPFKTMHQAIGRASIPCLFKAGNPLTPDDAKLFEGRQELIKEITNSFYEGKQSRLFFLDGIRRVGKTSLLNFLPKSLPESLIPIKINFESLGITRTSFSSAEFLYELCEQIFQALPEPECNPILPLEGGRFISRPALAFQEFFRSIKRSYPGKVIFLMIDEFQVLLEALANSGRNSLVLDLIRSSTLDEGLFSVLFTGATRYDWLSSIYNHRIIASLSRLRISFLSRDDVGRVIRAGMEKWVKVPEETIQAIYDLSGGYPRVVHLYGWELVELLNKERRTIVTPEDVERVTREEILNNDELFSHLWIYELGVDEERFIETLLRQLGNRQSMSTNEFFETLPARNRSAHEKAQENLRTAEILDSSQPDTLRFSGLGVRRWIELHVDTNRQLHLSRKQEEHKSGTRGSAGIFIDHENLVKALERISNARGVPYGDRPNWFQTILANIMREAEKRIGHMDYRVTVAFWNRPNEAALTPAYARYDFMTRQPTEMNKPNAADFKLTTEVETAYQTSIEKNNRIKRAIVITGDGDFAQTVLKLKNAGVEVQVWGGSKETNERYVELVGHENVIILDDVCGL